MNEMLKEQILDGMDDRFLYEAMNYHGKKKNKVIMFFGKMAACIAIVLGVSFSTLSIAAVAGNITAYEVLYGIYPDIAEKLVPINVSCEDAGVQMVVEGASIQGECAYIYISMQDMVGDRIDETIDLFDSYSIHSNADQIGNCVLIDFDEETGKATFLITVQNQNGRPIETGNMTFSVSKFLTGKQETRMALPEISLRKMTEIVEFQTGDQLNIRGGSYGPGSAAEAMPQKFLKVDNSKAFIPVPGVTITNYGLLDDTLHVQVYYEDIAQFDNHGYVYLTDGTGEDILPLGTQSFWDEQRRGSYEEYIFDVPSDTLADYEINGHFYTCQTLFSGDWKVRFNIGSLKKIEGDEYTEVY